MVLGCIVSSAAAAAKCVTRTAYSAGKCVVKTLCCCCKKATDAASEVSMTSAD
eukprot:CAMPEP_0118872172 /NCGR_PEP_ID=MMETSP1163-20130328/14469_1 /TAXON_ID=124430 /ORGANISM="Phaeomonas parva, Strain CCMP2877" /LENGTH=52 /DNA_ID=CAMNT_0006807335 /DNA_START=91 /DNA_END=249 /DNA_ORIENTATION=+